MRADFIRFTLVWLALVAAHAALALIPFAIYESKATALLPYYSYFGILDLMSKLGINVFGEFREGLFMAPVSNSGKALVALFWLVFHALAAITVMRVSRYYGSASNPRTRQSDA